jgi:beta-galactosidase
VFYSYDSLSGGCIWDWVDQAVWKNTDRVDPVTGLRQRVLAYGGDFDESPNDGPFCCNGIVDPFRAVSPKLIEVGHVYRNLVVSPAKDGAYELWNRFDFTPADAFAGTWRVLADGVEAAKGTFEVPAVAPRARAVFEIPALKALPRDLDGRKEHFVEFAFATKTDAPWAKAGWVVARDQLPFRVDPFDPEAAEVEKTFDVSRPMSVEETPASVIVEIGRTTAIFSRATGTLSTLIMRGVPVVEDPAAGIAAGPRLTCLRAFTDNDIWMRQGAPWHVDGTRSLECSGLTQLSYHPEPIVVGTNNTVTTVVDVAGSHGSGFRYEGVWTFLADGSVSLASKVEPYGEIPNDLPRLGLSMLLPPRLEAMRWYGRGPGENYVDRCTGSFFGVWSSTVTGQFVDYVRPQDNGYKSGVRWVEFTDRRGKGVRFSASEPLFVQALHHSREDLDGARFISGQRRHRTPLAKRQETFLNLDVRQTGLGGASCGPEPMAKYRFDPKAPVAWTMKIEAVK